MSDDIHFFDTSKGGVGEFESWMSPLETPRDVNCATRILARMSDDIRQILGSTSIRHS